MNTAHQSEQSAYPIIAGIEVTTDSEGRYNLNALHRASGLGKSKQPSNWIRLDSTQELQDELISSSNSSDLRSLPFSHKEGRYGGTFAHELLAITYAAWISPKFHLQVNQCFLDYKNGLLQAIEQDTPASAPALDPNKTLDVMGRCLNMATFLGYKENDTLLFADKMCAGLTGFSVCDTLGINTQPATLSLPFKAPLYTPTELGSMETPPVSPRTINTWLEAASLQTRTGKQWVPTEQGQRFCEFIEVSKAHNEGSVLQLKWCKSVLEVIHRLPAPSTGVTPPAPEGVAPLTPPTPEKVSPPDTPANSKPYQPEPDSVYQEPKYRGKGGTHPPKLKRVRDRSVGQYELDNYFSIWELADCLPYSSQTVRKLLLQQRIIRKVERYRDRKTAKYILTNKGWNYGTMYDPTTKLFHTKNSKRILTSNAQPVFSQEILELLDARQCA